MRGGGSEGAAGVWKRKYNHISIQTNDGDGWRWNIPVHTELELRCAAGPNIWTQRGSDRAGGEKVCWTGGVSSGCVCVWGGEAVKQTAVFIFLNF